MRILHGGSGPLVATGPRVVQEAYNTVRGGWADRIEAAVGEIAVRIVPGSPERFSVWAIGSPEEIVPYVESRVIDRDRRTGILAEIRRLVPAAPLSKLEQLAKAIEYRGPMSHLANMLELCGFRAEEEETK